MSMGRCVRNDWPLNYNAIRRLAGIRGPMVESWENAI